MHQKSDVELRLFGGFELRTGDRRIELPPAAQRLIALLAMHGGPARRAYVSGRLWPGAPEYQSAGRLRSALYRLRQGRTALIISGFGHLALEPGIWIDVNRLRAEALAAVNGRVPDRDLRAVAYRLSVSVDDVLPGWSDDWILAERERLRQLRLQAVECLGDRLLAQHQHHDALQAGLCCVAADPVRDSGHRLVMRAHVAAGDVADAIQQYQAYARLLDQELGVLPSPAMQALRRECLGGTLRRSA
jgi:DNA-binding SARP family transcriptional activator